MSFLKPKIDERLVFVLVVLHSTGYMWGFQSLAKTASSHSGGKTECKLEVNLCIGVSRNGVKSLWITCERWRRRCRSLKTRFLLGEKNKNDPHKVSEGSKAWRSFLILLHLALRVALVVKKSRQHVKILLQWSLQSFHLKPVWEFLTQSDTKKMAVKWSCVFYYVSVFSCWTLYDESL